MISEGLCSKHNRPLSHSKKCQASGKTRLVRTPKNFENNLKEDSIKDTEIDNSKSIEIRKTRSLLRKNDKSSDDDKSSSNKRAPRKRNSPIKKTAESDESSSSNSSGEENQSKKSKKKYSKIINKSVSKSSEESCAEAQLNDENDGKKSKKIDNKESEIISINESEEDKATDKSKNNKLRKTRSSSKKMSESSEDGDDVISSPKSRKILSKKPMGSNKSTLNENEEKLSQASEKIMSNSNSVLAEDSLLEEPLENKKNEEKSIENKSLENNSKKSNNEPLEMDCNNFEKEAGRKEYIELKKLKKDCLNQKNEIILLNSKVSSLSQSLLELEDRESKRAKKENELKLRIKAHRESDCNQRVVDIENIFLNE